MPKQPPLEKNLLLLHAIVSHFLLKETGKGGVERKRTKYDLGNEGSKMPFCKRYTF